MFTNVGERLESETGQYEKGKPDIVKLLFKYNAVVLLVVMFIVACFLSDKFLSADNMVNILRQQSTFMLVALGMLLVMLTGGIDLSVNSQVALTSIITCYCLKNAGFENYSWGLSASIVMAIAVGLGVGAINGFLVVKLRMPAFIVTLAMMYAVKGVAYIVTDANTILLDREVPAVKVLINFAQGADPLLHIPYPAILMIIIIVALGFFMFNTSFGRLVTATGSNETAVQLAGINSQKYKFMVYAVCGTLCGIAGVIVAARSG